MPIAFLLLTAQLTTPVSPPTQADTPSAPVQQSQSQGDPRETPATSTDRPHQIGLGAFGGSGGGASFRYFMNDRLGVDMNVGWSGLSNASGSGGTTFRVAPSAVLMLTSSHSLADLDVRPVRRRRFQLRADTERPDRVQRCGAHERHRNAGVWRRGVLVRQREINRNQRAGGLLPPCRAAGQSDDDERHGFLSAISLLHEIGGAWRQVSRHQQGEQRLLRVQAVFGLVEDH